MISVHRFLILLILFQPLDACDPIEMMTLKGRLTKSGNLAVNGKEYDSKFITPVNSTHFNVCICLVEKCLQKCCPFGTAMNGSQNCVKNGNPITLDVYDQHLNKLSSSINDFHLIHDKFILNASYDSDVHYILSNGQLHLPNFAKGAINVSLGAFCVENQILDNSQITTIVLICDIEDNMEYAFYPIGLIISIPFLIITLLVYALIPELQNINGKNLMSQLSAMIMGYTILAALQLMKDNAQRSTVCVVGTYIIQFSFLATFFWLNVTSYDLWYTFSGPGRLRGGHRRGTLKFYLYSIYAWGSSFIITIITVIIDKIPNISPNILKPNIDFNRCWFSQGKALYAYFYGPIAGILTINFIFFGITAYNLFVVQNQAEKILKGKSSQGSSSNKQKFILYLKLFFIMGVNWIMEVISAGFTETNFFFIISDICNSLQGVFIFFIFVFKKRTLQLLRAKLGYGKEKDRQTVTSFSSVRNHTNSVASHNLGSNELSLL